MCEWRDRIIRLLSRGLTASAVIASCAGPDAAFSDELTVKGTLLRGTVTALTSAAVEMKTEYGEGTIAIPHGDIEHLDSDGRYRVLYGDDGEATGRLLGVEAGTILVGDDVETAARIACETIHSGRAMEGFDASTLSRFRSRWRHWTARFDFGLGVTRSTTDTSTLAFGLRTERKKKPMRLVFQSSYLFDTEKQKAESRSTLDNEVRGLIKGEYDLTDRLFTVASFDAEYDEIDELSIRAIPRIGMGYRIYQTATTIFQLETAPSYTYERFFGGDTDDFAGMTFGAEANVKLPYDATLHGRADYLPSVSAWTEDYLIRSEVSLSIPIVRFLAFTASLFEQFDSTPAQGIERNELKTTVGISVQL